MHHLHSKPTLRRQRYVNLNGFRARWLILTTNPRLHPLQYALLDPLSVLVHSEFFHV